MIKGINKQIIEIKCTDDEYFEKALLFVRAEKCTEPYELLESCARDYCVRLSRPRHRNVRKIMAAVLLSLALMTAAAAVLFLLMT